MPASLIIEGLAQTGGILVGEAGGFAEKVVLAKIPRAEFFGVACAGDQLIYEVTLTDLRSEGAVVEAKAFLEGELLADVEIVFAHLDNSRANQIFGPKNFVFTQQLLGVLDLAKAQSRAEEAEAVASNGSGASRADSRSRRNDSSTVTVATRPDPVLGSTSSRISTVRPSHSRWSRRFPMLRSERRVVITGLGLDQPIGIGPEPFWAALAEGRAASARSRRSRSPACPTTSGPRSPTSTRRLAEAYALPRSTRRRSRRA